MTRAHRFWYRVNLFAARFTVPDIADNRPVRPAGPEPPHKPFRPFASTLIHHSVAEIMTPGFLPERPWWDQSGENNPWPIDPPERLDLSALDLIHRKDTW
jgi:hypothetical protein